MKQPSYKCSCVNCKKEYSSLGIGTHFMRTHGTQDDKNKFNNSILQKHKLRDENNSKHDNSSITYQELKQLVDGYD